MANDSLLVELLKRATDPLVPQIGEAGSRAAEKLTTPSLYQSPTMARLKGFAGGALESAGKIASDMTSPISLVAMAAGTAPGAGGLTRSLMKGAMGSSMGTALPGATTGAVSHLPPEFAAVGDEAAYNATKAAAPKLVDPVEQAFLRILSRGGR